MLIKVWTHFNINSDSNCFSNVENFANFFINIIIVRIPSMNRIDRNKDIKKEYAYSLTEEFSSSIAKNIHVEFNKQK